MDEDTSNIGNNKRAFKDLEQEKEQYQERSAKRQRELKQKAYSEMLETGEESSAYDVLKAAAEASEQDPLDAGVDYEGYENQLENQNSSSEIALEPFNLNKELQEGSFDEQGNYTENKTLFVRDPWYEEYLEQQNDKTSKEPPQEIKKAVRKDLKKESLPTDLISLKKVIAGYLVEEGENVLKALRRLKPITKIEKPKTKDKQKPKQNTDSNGKEPESDEKEKMREEKEKELLKTANNPENIAAFDRLTEAADLCLQNYSCFNIYHETREQLLEQIQTETGERFTLPSSWEYKLTEDSEEMHGPFSTNDMLSWYNQGYFQGDAVVFLRRVGTDDPFQPSDTVDFTVYL